jgi:hypothetical protein
MVGGGRWWWCFTFLFVPKPGEFLALNRTDAAHTFLHPRSAIGCLFQKLTLDQSLPNDPNTRQILDRKDQSIVGQGPRLCQLGIRNTPDLQPYSLVIRGARYCDVNKKGKALLSNRTLSHQSFTRKSKNSNLS